MNRALLFLIFCFSLTNPILSRDNSPAPDALKLSVGVLAFRGDTAASVTWQPTIDFLNSQLQGITLELVPLDLLEIDQAIKNQNIAFVLTNPGNYVQMQMLYGISRVASRIPLRAGSPEAATGSTFITRSDRDDINLLSDLRGRSVMAVSISAFGGFQIGWHELMRQGIEPFSEFDQLQYNQFPLDSIVFAVLAGKVDVGIVKSCLLEQMAKESKISLSDIKVINPLVVSGFPCQTSSQLYPDWPLAKLEQTPNFIAKAVTQALLSMPANSPAAQASKSSGWTIPVNYQPVHDLMQDLHLGDYDKHIHGGWRAIWEHYWQWIVAAVSCVLMVSLHSWRVNRLVHLRTHQLTTANRLLQQEMNDRQLANNKAKRHQAALAHVQRVSTMGEVASALAHEINQPLTAIISYAQGCIWRLKAGKDPQEFLEVAERIVQQASRAAEVIARIRAFIQNKTNQPKAINLNQIVSQALDLYYGQKKQNLKQIELALTPDLPLAWAEVVPLQQVLINLVTNGLDAMEHKPESEQLLRIRTYRQDEQFLMVQVEDSGTGIPVEVARRLFEPFLTTKSNGMGLGLSICQNLVEEQGGQLTLLNNSCNGVTIGFTLPIYQGQKPHD